MAERHEMNTFFMNIIVIWYIFCNVLLYVLMSIDKKRAEQNNWRIPEKVLFLWAFLGGGIGGILAMKQKRHKTKHLSFCIGFPCAVLLHIGIVCLFIWGI